MRQLTIAFQCVLLLAVSTVAVAQSKPAGVAKSRKIAKFNFDTAISQSSGLTDKFQRAMSTLGLADVCLQQVQQKPKPKR